MPELLLELFSEEIPARMQEQAAKDMQRLVVGALSDRGLMFESAKSFSGPRRLTLAIFGLPAKQPDVSEELKGPKVDAPQAALDGFLRKTGLTKDQLKIETTPKGDVYLAVIAREGRATEEVLAEILPDTLAKLPWPKSMRFPGSALRWVRPLHSVLCTFDGERVPFAFAGVESGDTTHGHRFLSHGPIHVRRFEDYEEKLSDAHVIIDAARRKDIIRHEAKQQAFALGLDLIEDEALLDEVAGLAEWPVVLTGQIDDAFMDVPPEILQTSMRTHQKYFALRDPATGKLANRFILVANMVAHDGGNEIVAGNERVLRARLSDAKFFWDQDRKTRLVDRVEALKGIVFHAKLGTQYDRAESIAFAARLIADRVGVDPNLAAKAGWLSKADLTTGVVGEFPELQGVMGGYYASSDNLPPELGCALSEQYLPLGPNSDIPKTALGQCLAVAEKISSIVALFYADEIPTGSSDPFALRRSALGIIRIVLAGNHRINLKRIILPMFALESVTKSVLSDRSFERALSSTAEFSRSLSEQEVVRLIEQAKSKSTGEASEEWHKGAESFPKLVMTFIADRLKVALREKGTRHDLIDAVFSLGNEDDLVRLVARVEALQAFLKTEDGVTLLAGYKRAANILKIEEKKDGVTYSKRPEPPNPDDPEEQKAFWNALNSADREIANELGKEDFVSAMRVMAGLRAPVDAFFDAVKVNVDDQDVRKNRLELLGLFRSTLHQVADFSKIEG